MDEGRAGLKIRHLAYDLDGGALILQPLHDQLRGGGGDHDGGRNTHFSGHEGCGHAGITT